MPYVCRKVGEGGGGNCVHADKPGAISKGSGCNACDTLAGKHLMRLGADTIAEFTRGDNTCAPYAHGVYTYRNED